MTGLEVVLKYLDKGGLTAFLIACLYMLYKLFPSIRSFATDYGKSLIIKASSDTLIAERIQLILSEIVSFREKAGNTLKEQEESNRRLLDEVGRRQDSNIKELSDRLHNIEYCLTEHFQDFRDLHDDVKKGGGG